MIGSFSRGEEKLDIIIPKVEENLPSEYSQSRKLIQGL